MPRKTSKSVPTKAPRTPKASKTSRTPVRASEAPLAAPSPRPVHNRFCAPPWSVQKHPGGEVTLHAADGRLLAHLILEDLERNPLTMARVLDPERVCASALLAAAPTVVTFMRILAYELRGILKTKPKGLKASEVARLEKLLALVEGVTGTLGLPGASRTPDTCKPVDLSLPGFVSKKEHSDGV